MEIETNVESHDRNAAKVAGYAAVIALTGAAALKAKRFVSSKLAARKKNQQPIAEEQ